jgi:hypothetical protein
MYIYKKNFCDVITSKTLYTFYITNLFFSITIHKVIVDDGAYRIEIILILMFISFKKIQVFLFHSYNLYNKYFFFNNREDKKKIYKQISYKILNLNSINALS